MHVEDPIELSNKSPFRDHLGLEYVSIGQGRSVCRMTIQEKHLNAGGALHGGASFTMVDSGMGNALRSLLAEDEWCVTVELDVSYMSPALSGTVVCVTKVLHRDNDVAFLESEVRLDERLVVKATGTLGITRR